jgi:1,4-dihydroxy-2-naphthoate octaprenyltransferase
MTQASESAVPQRPPFSAWVQGARPRTLPAAVSPVLAGTGSAAYADAFVWWKALLALVVSLALQIGVNYANDYSDGIRGTDEHRVGPLRLVGSGLARPSQVKAAAFASFGVAAVAGLVLAATTSWWLIAVGAAAIVAAWFYTGGSHPYGYHGLGEVFVFVFFGLVAVVGTAYVQVEEIRSDAVVAGCGVGALACAILVANNLRDIPTDRVSGKRTLAVLLGDAGTRVFYAVLVLGALVVAVALAITVSAWLLLGLVSLPLAARATNVVRSGAVGPHLIPVLRDTGLTELVYATGLLVGYLMSR